MKSITGLLMILFVSTSFGQILEDNPADGLLCINGGVPVWTVCEDDTGLDTVRYENGNIWTIGQHKDGKKHGQWKCYYESGSIMAIGNIENSMPIDLWEFYYENGVMSAKGGFVLGTFELGCIGSENYIQASCKYEHWWSWYPNGHPWKEIEFGRSTAGEEELHGDYIIWDSTGYVIEQGTMHHNRKRGIWTYWNNDSIPHVKQYEIHIEDTIKLNLIHPFESTLIQDNYEENEDENVELERYIEWLRQEWDSIPNPVTATYEGSMFGDYLHIIFKDSTGREIDFGFGDNQYGTYILGSPDDPDSEDIYIGKSFKITWGWRPSKFPCCSGSYDVVERSIPSIIKFELLEDIK